MLLPPLALPAVLEESEKQNIAVLDTSTNAMISMNVLSAPSLLSPLIKTAVFLGFAIPCVMDDKEGGLAFSLKRVRCWDQPIEQRIWKK